MSENHSRASVLELDGSNAQPLSVRAKALVFHDPVSRSILDYIERIGPSEAPVLIHGETGTGKELVARHLHLLSGRSGPFVAINCGAINDLLSESELFGHEAGSFTGAVGRREGWFEAAHGGTLFLDEIGDLPLNLQVKLLRVLQEREVVRVGSRKPIAVDVRLLAGTNVDLDHAVQAGRFRRDLLYRINIAQVLLPPLRERPGDILPLVDHFLKVYSKRMQRPPPLLAPEAERLLLGYQWPGNIRELENVVHFALLVSGDSEIRPAHIKVTGGWSERSVAPAMPRVETAQAEPAAQPLERIAEELRRLFAGPAGAHFETLEKLVVGVAFRTCQSNQVHTAQLLGISRNVVRTLLKRHGLIAQTDDGLSAEPSAERASTSLDQGVGCGVGAAIRTSVPPSAS